MKRRGKVIGILNEPYFGVAEEKECKVENSYWREGILWFTLKDNQGKVFESPAYLWSNQKTIKQ